MIMDVYSVLDRGVSAFNAPVMAPSELAVKRALSDLFIGESRREPIERHPYVRFPDDYDLYLIAKFDTESGAIVPVSPVVRVCSLSDISPISM